jgi:predicted Zn-dependent protease
MRIDRQFAIGTLVLVLALAACAWFVISIRQAHDTSRAQSILSTGTPLTAAQANRADSLLRAAAFLNPDRQVDILRAELVAERGNFREADRILFGVVRAEPMNINAWFELAAHPLKPRVLAEALDAVNRLVRHVPSH